MITAALPVLGSLMLRSEVNRNKEGPPSFVAEERKQPPTVIHVSLTPDDNGDISVDAAADIIHVPKGNENSEFFKFPLEVRRNLCLCPCEWERLRHYGVRRVRASSAVLCLLISSDTPMAQESRAAARESQTAQRSRWQYVEA